MMIRSEIFLFTIITLYAIFHNSAGQATDIYDDYNETQIGEVYGDYDGCTSNDIYLIGKYKYCIHVSEATEYGNKCMFVEEPVAMSEMLIILRELDVEAVWHSRVKSNGDETDKSKIHNNSTDNTGYCIRMTNENFIRVKCNDTYPYVCVSSVDEHCQCPRKIPGKYQCNINPYNIDTYGLECRVSNYSKYLNYSTEFARKMQGNNFKLLKVLDISENFIDFFGHATFPARGRDGPISRAFLLNNMQNTSHIQVLDINPIHKCEPDEILVGSVVLHWNYALVGSIATSDELCIQPNGLPVTRQCQGDCIHGAEWSPPSGICNISESRTSTLLNEILHDENLTAEDTTEKILEVTKESAQMKAVDVNIVSLIFQQTAQKLDGDGDKILNSTVKAVNDLFEVPHEEMKITNRLAKSTDVLLQNFDKILEGVTPKELDETGVFRLVTKNLIYQVSDLTKHNGRGIALHRPPSRARSTMPLTEFIIEDITTALLESSDLDNLDIAVVIPDKLFNEIKSRNSNPRIHITIFYNDTLFIESEDRIHEKIGTKIISVTIPGFRSTLPSPIQFIFNNDHKNKINDTCVYWKFGDDFQNSTSVWSSEDVISKEHAEFTRNDIVMCEADHLTHFALLVPNLLNYQIGGIHEKILDIVTAVNLTLSFIGIIIIFVTAIRFRSWREKESTKILLHIATGIILQTVLLYLSDQRNIYKSDVYCILSGCLLHYFILVGFAWMLIISFCQYQRYIRVFGSTPVNFILYSSLISWGTPIICIAIALSINYETYIPNMINTTLCYPSDYMYYSLLLAPILVVLLINMCMFIWVLMTICNRDTISKSKSRNKNIIELKVGVFLFFLLGLVWFFGIFSSISSNLVFTYLFSMTATLQGFVLFLFCVVLDKQTRDLWQRSFKEFRFTSVTSTTDQATSSK